MVKKNKAAFPSKAGRPEKTALSTREYLNNSRIFRQRVKQVIVWMAVWCVIPSWAAAWLIQHGGLAHD